MVYLNSNWLQTFYWSRPYISHDKQENEESLLHLSLLHHIHPQLKEILCTLAILILWLRILKIFYTVQMLISKKMSCFILTFYPTIAWQDVMLQVVAI